MPYENTETTSTQPPEKSIGVDGQLMEGYSTVDALITDYQESENRVLTVGVAAGTVMALSAGVMRAPTLALPFIESGTVDVSHSKPLAALAVGGLYAGWVKMSATPLNRLRHEFRNTASAISVNHPKIANTIGRVAAAGTKLPGFERTNVSDTDRQGRIRSMGKAALTRVSRAWTATFVSTTAYLAGANLHGQSDKDIKRLTNNLAVEVGAVSAVTAGLMSEVPGYVKLGSVGLIMAGGLAKDVFMTRQQRRNEQLPDCSD